MPSCADAFCGIIPARAGFTRRRGKLIRLPGDHPRSRGVYKEVGGVSTHVLGSSPLARGLRHARPPGLGGCRIIPARAGFTMRTGTTPSPRADHPRSRGVYQEFIAQATQMGGSSPLARGLRLAAPRPSLAARIIPARAGFTRQQYLVNKVLVGSSPLARGLLSFGFSGRTMCRIIPARAGFTATSGCTTTRAPDHPRSRGVYAPFEDPDELEIGSSPLARGLPALRI